MDTIGHHKEREALRETVLRGTTAQAYLFVGPRGVGKSLCALEFAALLVREPDFEPSVDKPHPFDVLILRPHEETKRGVTKTKNIPAESVRETFPFLDRFPTAGGFRVLIIDDAHRLSETAQNALLKTLEEPPSTAVIILVTHELGALLPTVLSRVKRVVFDFVPEETLHSDVVKRFTSEELQTIAPFFFTLGRPGMVLSALRDPAGFAVERELLSLLFRLSTLSLAERMLLSEKLAFDTGRALRLLEWWLPGLHAQALRVTEARMTKRYFLLLAEAAETMRLLKTTQSNARLLFDKLFLAV